MKIWIDAQLPPTLAQWLIETFGLAFLIHISFGIQKSG